MAEASLAAVEMTLWTEENLRMDGLRLIAQDELAQCYTCREVKTGEHFYRDSSRKNGYYPNCRDCARDKRAASNRRWRSKNRRTWLATKLAMYAMTVDEFDAMLAAQGGVCAICKQDEQIEGHRLSVDHDHVEGHVRGLLCRKCNTALGHLNDDPELVKVALEYLERPRS